MRTIGITVSLESTLTRAPLQRLLIFPHDNVVPFFTTLALCSPVNFGEKTQYESAAMRIADFVPLQQVLQSR